MNTPTEAVETVRRTLTDKLSVLDAELEQKKLEISALQATKEVLQTKLDTFDSLFGYEEPVSKPTETPPTPKLEVVHNADRIARVNRPKGFQEQASPNAAAFDAVNLALRGDVRGVQAVATETSTRARDAARRQLEGGTSVDSTGPAPTARAEPSGEKEPRCPVIYEAIAQVMGSEPFGAADVYLELDKRGWLPPSSDPQQYISYTLSKHTDLFERTARGKYIVKAAQSQQVPDEVFSNMGAAEEATSDAEGVT